MKSDKALVVLTGKPKQRLFSEGGTSHWALTPATVRSFEYVVCVRHGSPDYDPGPGARPEAHGEAFLVGKIADVVFTYRENDRDRYMVTFSEIAEVSVPDFWDHSRNPVRYMDVSEIKTRGIDFDKLQFKPFAPPATAATPMTIPAAKEALSAALGVPVDRIEIIIRA